VRFNKLAFCAITAAGVTCAGGCASAENGSPAVPEQPTITVDSVPAAEEGGLYVAAADGFFKQQDLTVKIKSITGGEEGIPDLQSGKAQLVCGNYVSFVLAQVAGRANGKPASFRVVAPASETQPGSNGLYVLPKSPYKSVASLAESHATVGLNTSRNVGQVMLGALMRDNREALEQAMERYTGLRPIIADTMPYDAYPVQMADAASQRVSNAMFEFGLTPGLKQPYQMSAMTGS
jgi:ABC-type nitrate/sulfonate/bicarbonate transport system substrate-binding protein